MCFGTFKPITSHKFTPEPDSSSLRQDDPEVITANRLCTEDKLLMSDSQQDPTPNGMYYGFVKDGMAVTMTFDGDSRLKHIAFDRSYDTLIYTMLGTAIRGFFTKKGGYEPCVVILEPVDQSKFDGTRLSLPEARLPTVEGQPFSSSELPKLLGLEKTSRFGILKSSFRKSFKRLKTIFRSSPTAKSD